MKKKINIGGKVAVICSLAIISLTACGPAADDKVTTTVETTTVPETTKVPETTTVPESTTIDKENPTGGDVACILESTEQQVSELKRELVEDAVTQADMNQISYQICELWNEALDFVWLELEKHVDEATWEKLSKEQQEWTENKIKNVELAGAQYEGGSMQVMAECVLDAELTEERVYELMEYFNN